MQRGYWRPLPGVTMFANSQSSVKNAGGVKKNPPGDFSEELSRLHSLCGVSSRTHY